MPLTRRLDRFIDALTSAERRDRTVLAALAAYALVWTLYGVFAKAGQDISVDAAELADWSRHPALGYAKHPPLGAWLLHGWFLIFPTADWSYYFFGAVYSSIGLWFAWLLYREYLDPEKRVVGLALLTFVPMYNFFALRFNIDVVLPPLWTATTLCFVRAFESRKAGWAALAGAAAALAMLAKYSSLFLLLGLALAALLDSRRGPYFRSLSPWITVAVGALLLVPHLGWLFFNGFSPLHYAFDKHAAQSLSQSVFSAIRYLAGAVAYMAVPALLVTFAIPKFGRGLNKILVPNTERVRFAVTAFWVPIILPVIVALVSKTNLNPIWSMAGFALLPVVLVASPLAAIDRRALRFIVTAAIVFPLVMTAAAPAIAITIHYTRQNTIVTSGRMLAQRMLSEWHKHTDLPLRVVGGDFDLAYVTAFYLPGRPNVLPVTEPNLAPWIDPKAIAEKGAILVCHEDADVKDCVHGHVTMAIKRLLQGTPATESEAVITPTFMGLHGQPSRFLIYIALPSAARIRGN